MQKIWVEHIGEVTLNKSKRAKNIRISIKPYKGVILTYPYYSNKRKAIHFLHEKKLWVIKNLDKAKKLERIQTVFTKESSFQTYEHKLKIETWDKERFSVKRENNTLLIKLSKNLNITSDIIQQRIRKEIEKTWKIEAEKYFPSAFNKLAKSYDFEYYDLTIKNVKSKWGSCSYSNNIVLSLHLMRLPKHLIKYVMLHELCHTKEKNHQAPFWELMNKVTNNQAKSLDRELKEYSTKFY